MACGEPQWWYDLINQTEVDNQVFGDLINRYPDVPNLSEELVSVQPMIRTDYDGPEFPIYYEGSVSMGCRGEVNSCGEVMLGAPHTCTLPFELEEDTPEEAYERAMKGI